MSLVIFYTPTMTAEGDYQLRDISDDEAKETVSLYDAGEIISAVESASAAGVLSAALGVTVPVATEKYVHARENVHLALRSDGVGFTMVSYQPLKL
jgi:hypothetical protein